MYQLVGIVGNLQLQEISANHTDYWNLCTQVIKIGLISRKANSFFWAAKDTLNFNCQEFRLMLPYFQALHDTIDQCAYIQDRGIPSIPASIKISRLKDFFWRISQRVKSAPNIMYENLRFRDNSR